MTFRTCLPLERRIPAPKRPQNKIRKNDLLQTRIVDENLLFYQFTGQKYPEAYFLKARGDVVIGAGEWAKLESLITNNQLPEHFLHGSKEGTIVRQLEKMMDYTIYLREMAERTLARLKIPTGHEAYGIFVYQRQRSGVNKFACNLLVPFPFIETVGRSNVVVQPDGTRKFVEEMTPFDKTALAVQWYKIYHQITAFRAIRLLKYYEISLLIPTMEKKVAEQMAAAMVPDREEMYRSIDYLDNWIKENGNSTVKEAYNNLRDNFERPRETIQTVLDQFISNIDSRASMLQRSRESLERYITLHNLTCEPWAQLSWEMIEKSLGSSSRMQYIIDLILGNASNYYTGIKLVVIPEDVDLVNYVRDPEVGRDTIIKDLDESIERLMNEINFDEFPRFRHLSLLGMETLRATDIFKEGRYRSALLTDVNSQTGRRTSHDYLKLMVDHTCDESYRDMDETLRSRYRTERSTTMVYEYIGVIAAARQIIGSLTENKEIDLRIIDIFDREIGRNDIFAGTTHKVKHGMRVGLEYSLVDKNIISFNVVPGFINEVYAYAGLPLSASDSGQIAARESNSTAKSPHGVIFGHVNNDMCVQFGPKTFKPQYEITSWSDVPENQKRFLGALKRTGERDPNVLALLGSARAIWFEDRIMVVERDCRIAAEVIQHHNEYIKSHLQKENSIWCNIVARGLIEGIVSVVKGKWADHRQPDSLEAKYKWICEIVLVTMAGFFGKKVVQKLEELSFTVDFSGREILLYKDGSPVDTLTILKTLVQNVDLPPPFPR